MIRPSVAGFESTRDKFFLHTLLSVMATGIFAYIVGATIQRLVPWRADRAAFRRILIFLSVASATQLHWIGASPHVMFRVIPALVAGLAVVVIVPGLTPPGSAHQYGVHRSGGS